MEFKLEIGKELQSITLPEDKVLDVLTGPDIAPLSFEQIKGEIENGVRNSAPENISEKKIVIIVPDHTRLWVKGDLYVPVIIDTLLGIGAQASNIKIIIALGTHADAPADRFPSLVGEGIADKIEVINSANKNTERLTKLGKTAHGTELYITKEACEADHVIIFGGLLHHLIAGFGGGRKYILPGIAGYDSIQQNHSLAMLPDGAPHQNVSQAQIKGNPVHEDMTEAAGMFLKDKTSVLLAVAANGKGEIFYAKAGDWNEVFAEGCEEVNRSGSVNVKEKADFAVISAGGYRKDGQLYQSTKALFNTYGALKDGGKILFFAEAREGVGSDEFEKVLIDFRGNPAGIGNKLVESFSMPSYVAYRVVDILTRFDVTLVSKYSKEETEKYGFKYTDNIEEYVENLEGKGYVIPSAENILPIVES